MKHIGAKIMSLLCLALLLTLLAALGATAWAEGEELSDLETPLTFKAAADEVTVALSWDESWDDGSYAEYKLKNGDWTAYTKGTTINLNNQGDTVQFRGNNIKTNNANHFTVSDDCYVYGNVMSLVYPESENYKSESKQVAKYQFYYLFSGCEQLLNHDTRDIVLPAETLADFCYSYMFYGCTSLTRAPELPAETLTNDCYDRMFSGCTSLTRAPALPAETLTNDCYDRMFSGCTSLTRAPALPAETLADSCYVSMFSGCTSLTRAPELPAETLAPYCYYYMFYNCVSLNAVTCLATNISANQATNDWLRGVALNGIFTKAAGMNGWYRGSASGIPSGWEEQDYVPTDVTGVTLDKTEAQSINVGGTVSFTATVSPDNATDKTVLWSVGGTNAGAVKLYSDAACNTEVGTEATSTLTVYAKGISAGSATVTVTSNDDSSKTASCDVTINPTITGADLVLNGSLDFRFYVAVPAGFDGTNAKMTFTIPGRNPETGASGRTVEVAYDAAITSEDSATAGQKIFTCPVYSIEMAKDITAVFSYGDNKTVSKTASVQDYLNSIPSGSASALVTATKNYGHYMQTYLAGVHGFTLSADTYPEIEAGSTSLTPADMTELANYKRTWGTGGFDSAALKSMGFFDTFAASTALNIRLVFNNAPDTVTATVNDGAVTANVKPLNSTTYQIEIPNIAANNLGTAYHVVVTADGAVVYDVNMSALSYVYAVLNAGRSQTGEADALTAFYNYYTAARQYGQSN